jgi:hypothetical protein
MILPQETHVFRSSTVGRSEHEAKNHWKTSQNKHVTKIWCPGDPMGQRRTSFLCDPVPFETTYYLSSLGFFLFFPHIILEVVDRRRLPGSILWMQCDSPLSRVDLRPQHHLCSIVFGECADLFCSVEIQVVQYNNCADTVPFLCSPLNQS